MSIKNMKKEDLELLSYKDISYLLIEEYGCQKTPDLFKKIVKLLELPNSYYESKIGDFYMMLTTDKRFILLDNGEWDLRNKHTSDKVLKIEDEDEDSTSEEIMSKTKEEEEEEKYEIDSDDGYDDTDDDFKDLVIVDEEDLNLDN